MMAMKVTDAELFESLEWLRDDGGKISQARARRLTIEEGRKHLKAKLMAASKATSAAAKEQDAYAAPEYRELLIGLQVAIEQDEHFRMLTDYHKARIEVWRSMSANQRAIDRAI